MSILYDRKVNLRPGKNMALDQAVVDNVKMAEYISTVDNRVTNKTALSSYSVPLASHMRKILNATRDFVKVYQYAKNK